MKTLKQINEELKKPKKYYLFECGFCHEKLVAEESDIDKFVYTDLPENVHGLKCCNCGNMEMIDANTLFDNKCNKYGELLHK